MIGTFITFEGGEGSGKTTQIALLQKYFADCGKKCMVTREPGGTVGGDAIRKLLLTGGSEKWNPVSETLLFQAARVEHVERVIKPALARGEIVLCDRFLDSTIVYQGLGKGLGMEYIQQLHRLTVGNFLPDFTIILDIEPKAGIGRAKARAGEETRFENMHMEFHDSVRRGFLSLAEKEPSRYVIVDASRSIEAVHKSITDALLSLAVC
jgi:dTMP kinase